MKKIMKIEIDYNGAYAICKVNGKYLYQCDSLTIAQTLHSGLLNNIFVEKKNYKEIIN